MVSLPVRTRAANLERTMGRQLLAGVGAVAIAGLVSVAAAHARIEVQSTTRGSLIEDEAAVAARSPGPHEGGGNTTVFPFFAKAPDFKMAFRKRILHQGSTIGYHVQDFDEVYYILSGTGEYTLNGVTRQVGPGTALLTRVGDSHGLRPAGDGEVALIIAYPAPNR